MKGSGEAYQSWNSDQAIATHSSTCPAVPAGARAPVSLCATSSCRAASSGRCSGAARWSVMVRSPRLPRLRCRLKRAPGRYANAYPRPLSITLAVMHGALTVSDQAFGAMKWGGIAVLFALAVRMLLSRSADDDRPATSAQLGMSEVGGGLMVGLSSPYYLVFLLALLPQFIPAEMGIATVMTVVAIVLSGAAVGQLGAVIVGLCSRGVLGGRARWLDRAAAVCLIGFAATALVAPIV